MKMKIEIVEGLALDGQQELSLADLHAMSGLTLDELQLLAECQALSPGVDDDVSAGPEEAVRVSPQCVVLARFAARLSRDFDLDANGTMVTLRLLKRIQDLETEVLALRAQMPSSSWSA